MIQARDAILSSTIKNLSLEFDDQFSYPHLAWIVSIETSLQFQLFPDLAKPPPSVNAPNPGLQTAPNTEAKVLPTGEHLHPAKPLFGITMPSSKTMFPRKLPSSKSLPGKPRNHDILVAPRWWEKHRSGHLWLRKNLRGSGHLTI